VEADPVGAVGGEIFAGEVGAELEGAGGAGGVDDVGGDDDAGGDSFGEEFDGGFFHAGYAGHVHGGLFVSEAIDVEGERGMGDGPAWVGAFAGDFAAVEGEADFVAVAEYGDVCGGEEGGVVGDEDHGSVAEAGDVDFGGALALEEIVAEFWEAEEVEDTAEEGLAVVAALAVDAGPEVGATEAIEVGAAGVVAAAGDDFVEAGGVGGRLDEERGFAPGAGYAAAGLLVGPVVDVVAPFADPGWFGAVAAEIVDVPGLAVFFAIAGGEALIAGIFFVNGLLETGEDWAVVGFVEGGFPEDDGGVVAVAADHEAGVGYGAVLEFFPTDELPAGIGDDGEHAELVAGVEEGGGLGVVAAVGGEAGLAEFFDVAVLGAVGHGVADKGMVLMTVGADGEEFFVVDEKALLRVEGDSADSDAGGEFVDGSAVAEEAGFEGVEMGVIRMPEARVGDFDVVGEG